MVTPASAILLIVLLLFATTTDIKSGKIPNRVTFPMIIGGLVLQFIINGHWESLTGALVAFVILIYPVASRWLGAGDLKMAVAVGVLMGPTFVVVSLGLAVIALVLMSVINQIQKGAARSFPAVFPITAGCTLSVIFFL